MKIVLFLRSIVCLTILACWTGSAIAQSDNPLGQNNLRANEMNRMVREFIAEAKELERQGDKAGALLMKNKALGLMKSLRSMRGNQSDVAPESAGKETPEPPAVTRAEAVVTLNNCVTLLNLLNQKELGRRINNIMRGIANDEEIEQILEYDRQRGKNPAANLPPVTPAAESDEPAPSPHRSAEQVENQLAALKTAMDGLLDAGQPEQAKLLAQSIMLRRSALREQQTTWQYENDYSAEREVEVLRLAKKRLFENGKMMQAKLIEELAGQVERDLRETKNRQQEPSSPAAELEKQNQLITRLVEKFEQSEEERLKLQSELRAVQRQNKSLNQRIEQLKTKGKQ